LTNTSQNHLCLTLTSSRYRDQAHLHFTHKRRQNLYALPQRHQQLLTSPPISILSTFTKVDDAIDKNAEIAEAFLETGLKYFDSKSAGLDEDDGASFVTKGSNLKGKPSWQGPVNHVDQEKAHSTLRQLYRDWSAEGKPERDACYRPVLRALDEEFGHIPDNEKGRIKVLVPGSGLSRSTLEIAHKGYTAMGLEISYHQIIASLHMLNFVIKSEQWELYPWAHDSSNHLSRKDQLQCVRIPDIHPAMEAMEASIGKDTPFSERFGLSSADFCVEYIKEEYMEMYDAVTTIFFIDTAPNFLRYVESVFNCLKDGGVWINLGPLKWHFEGNPPGSKEKSHKPDRISDSGEDEDKGIAEPGSVEFTNDEILLLLENLGFVVEKQEVMTLESGYISNPNSMWVGTYRPSFWIARKCVTL
jgi:carnosine N-methyltransferase